MTSIEHSKVLIVQPFLYRFSGSEVIALELASELIDQGALVSIATWTVSDELREEVARIGGLSLLKLDSPEFEDYLSQGRPDLVWSHQGLLPEQILRNPDGTKFVFCHLSAFIKFEFPFAPLLERNLAGLVYFVSEEVKDKFAELGMLGGIDDDRFRVLANPAPSAYHHLKPERNSGLESVLVVSNHLPDELIEAITLLRQSGVNVEVVGALQHGTDASPKRVTPAVLQDHDCVVSIGKTVQYGLCSGMPAYCYDYFGGPGWLSEDNFELAAYHNFSGRGFEKRSANQIAEEIRSGFELAREFSLDRLYDLRQDYSYARIVRDLEGLLESECANAKPSPGEVIEGYLNAHDTVREFGTAYYEGGALAAKRQFLTDQHVGNLEGIIASLQSELDEQRSISAELEAASRRSLPRRVASKVKRSVKGRN